MDLMEGTLANDDTTSLAFERKRKREPLEFVKCDFCRTDKQKCLPLKRKWPDQKCDRCIKKRFACSAGTRKERRTKHTIREESAVGEEKLTVQDWIFLLSFYKIMCKALKRLRDIRIEMQNICAPDVDTWYFFKRCSGTEERAFETFFEKLEIAVRKVSRDMILSNHPSVPGDIYTAMTGHLFLEPYLGAFDLGKDICTLCVVNDEETTILEKLVDCQDIGGEFFARVTRLQRHLLHDPHLQISYEFDQEWQRLDELTPQYREKAQGILTKLGLDQSMPKISWTCPFMYFEWSDSIRDSSKDIALQRTDCLGRTELHLMLDAETPNWVEEPDVEPQFRKSIEDVQDILGRTALHIICQKGLSQYFDEVIDFDFSSTTAYGLQPLHYAAYSGSLDLCRRILEHDKRVDINALDFNERTPLSYALPNETPGLVEIFLAEPTIDPDRGKDEFRPMSQAVSRKMVPTAQKLLQCGVNPNLRCKGSPYLVYSVEKRAIKLMKLLCEQQNINPNARDLYGRSAIAYAAMDGFEEGVQYLMNLTKIDLNCVDNDGRTPLLLAVEQGHIEVVRLLLTKPSVSLVRLDKRGRTALNLYEVIPVRPEIQQMLDFENGRRRNEAWTTVPPNLMGPLELGYGSVL